MKKETKNELNDLLQLVSFELNGEEFGIDILSVQEIIRLLDITEIPNSPNFIDGIINIRGKVIPVVNLRVKLNMPKKENSPKTRIVVVDINGKTIGFIVDAVTEVRRIPTSITEVPPSMVAGLNSEFIKSIAKLEHGLLILIDIDKILDHSEKLSLSQVA